MMLFWASQDLASTGCEVGEHDATIILTILLRL